MIIGITGTNGAGKGSAVAYLAAEKGFTHYSSSGYLAEELERRGVEKTRSNLRALGNEFRQKHGSGYLTETFLKMAKASRVTDLVIESIRSTGEAQKLKEAGGVLIIIDADRKLRYERIYARRSGKDLVDYDAFVEQEEREWYGTLGGHDMNIKTVMDMADHRIENNGTLEDLQREIDSVLARIG
jgi:dephospho-CoA kinase